MNWFDYTTASEGGLGPVRASVIEYVLAGNGVFARAMRQGLEVLIPVASCEVRGLPCLEPYVKLDYPKLPGSVLELLFEESRRMCLDAARAVETLFHIYWDAQWFIVRPEQEASSTHVRPVESGIGSSHERALLEVHSHHSMPARFSRTDDEDERNGFRVYGVLGRIFDHPTITLRAGCHGYFYEIPAEWIFDLDADLAARVGSGHSVAPDHREEVRETP